MKYIFYCLFLLSTSLHAQSFSNKGTDFWVTYPAHIDTTSSIMGIYITSNTNATGSINVNGTAIPFSVSAGSVIEKFIGSTVAADASNSYVYLSANGIKTGAAIHIVSNDNPIVVYAHIIHSARSGATLLLPSNVWGKQYVVPSYSSIGNSKGQGYGTISVVAATANTSIQITPAAKTLDGHTAGIAYTVQLDNPGDVYQMEFQQNADISGTVVQSISNGGSCQKIAVFSSTTWSAFGCSSASSGDNLFQQLFPVTSWGQNFATVPALTRTSDVIRVYVTDPNTIITKTENGVASVLTGMVTSAVANSYYYEYSTGNATFLQASKPVSVVQYFTTMACQNGAVIGDPEMIVLNPIEQTINNITLFSAHQKWINARFAGQSNITNCYLNIVISNNSTSSFTINGIAQSGFIPITGTRYSYLQADVTNITLSNPVQTLAADSNFIAIAYGFGNVESYGYNAGTNVKDFSQLAVFKNSFAILDSPITCINTPFRYSVPLGFQPTSITWDFSAAPDISPSAQITQNAPLGDSISTLNGTNVTYYSDSITYHFNANNTSVYADTLKIYTNSATADGCGSTSQIYTVPVTIIPLPVSAFNIKSTGCVTDSVHFTDASINIGNASTISGIWNFGNAVIDTSSNPVYKYDIPGTYTLQYRSINSYGCVGDTSGTISLSSLPVAAFSISDTTCTNSHIQFMDASTIDSGRISSWYWNLGNQVYDTLYTSATVSNIYANPVMDSVSLTVVSNTGCTVTNRKLLSVHPVPQVAFTIPQVCLNDAWAIFTDSSTISDSSASQFRYQWNFNAGNPGISPGPQPSIDNTTATKDSAHYQAYGDYKVSLMVISKDGCIASDTVAFTVNGSKPHAYFVVLDSAMLCSNLPVVIRDSSTVDFGNITYENIYWEPMIDSIVQQPDSLHLKTNSFSYPSFQNPAIQQYNIKLIAHSGLSSVCEDSLTQIITLHQSPVVQFDVLPGICSDTTARQITQAYETGVPVVPGSYLFSGAGVSSAGLFTPGSAGTYPLKYVYSSAIYGCKDSASQTQTVWPLPNARWGISNPQCEKNNISFTDSSVAVYGQIVSWFWKFGDGTDTLLNRSGSLIKVYDSAKVYQAGLTVVTDSGCSNNDVQAITVHYLPAVNFGMPAVVCLPAGNAVFTDSTSIGDGSQALFSYLWNFGDSTNTTPSVIQDPTHHYSATGSYRVSLKVTSKDNCTDSLTQLFSNIFPQPRAGFSASAYTICLNDSIAFTDTSKGISSDPINWNWSFGNGTVSTVENPVVPFSDSGTFIISLYFYNQQGCISDTVSQSVLVNPLPHLQMESGPIIIQGSQVVLQPAYYYGSDLHFLWSPASFLSNDSIVETIASPPEDIMYTLKLTGTGDCSVSGEVKVTVLKQLVIPNAFSPNGDGINDVWQIQYLESYPGITVRVFDRSGMMVFTSDGYAQPWDGTYKGKPLPVGTYYYLIDTPTGHQKLSGSVTILR